MREFGEIVIGLLIMILIAFLLAFVILGAFIALGIINPDVVALIVGGV